jgi:hypothetical protein
MQDPNAREAAKQLLASQLAMGNPDQFPQHGQQQQLNGASSNGASSPSRAAALNWALPPLGAAPGSGYQSPGRQHASGYASPNRSHLTHIPHPLMLHQGGLSDGSAMSGVSPAGQGSPGYDEYLSPEEASPYGSPTSTRCEWGRRGGVCALCVSACM